MEAFNLDIIPGRTCPVCHASQYDIGRTIRINLFEGVSVYTLTGAETISLSVRKPDGNVVTAAVTNTSDSYVEIETTEQMTACHGSNLCELKLEIGADVIGTMNFILEVEQDPLEGGVQSASEIYNLQTQVAGMVATEVANQYDSANVIFDNDPTAGHGVGYAVTSEGVLNALGSLQTTLEGEIDTAVDTVEDIIADAYDENNTYNTGDYSINNDVLYKCNDDNVTGPWDATKWDATTVADELQLKADAANTYTKTQVDTALSGKTDDSDYMQTETQTFTYTDVDSNTLDIVFTRRGYVVNIEIFNASKRKLPTSWTGSLGTISNTMKPLTTTHETVFNLALSSGNNMCVRILTSGQVSIIGSSSNADWIQGHACYHV